MNRLQPSGPAQRQTDTQTEEGKRWWGQRRRGWPVRGKSQTTLMCCNSLQSALSASTELHTGPKDLQLCSSQISIFEISPTFTQTLPIHITLVHFPMNKSKSRVFYLHTTSRFEGKSDSRRGKRSLTPSFIISDRPQLKLRLHVSTAATPRGVGAARGRH